MDVGIPQLSKLIRDKIPDLARARGDSMTTHIATHEEYGLLLRKKLLEELAEYLESGEPEEIADMLEVLRAIAIHRGMSAQRLYGRCKQGHDSPATAHKMGSMSRGQLHESLYFVVLKYIETDQDDDLLNVLLWLRLIAQERSFSFYFLFKLRDKKRIARGGFEGRVVWDAEKDTARQ